MCTFFKTTVALLVLTMFFSCGKKQETQLPAPVYESERGGTTEMTQVEKIALGDKLFRGKGTCASCHIADKKVIGPSVQEIVSIYDKEGASIVAFLKGESDPIVDPAQFIIMQANLQITKKMSNTDLEAIEAYMRSL